MPPWYICTSVAITVTSTSQQRIVTWITPSHVGTEYYSFWIRQVTFGFSDKNIIMTTSLYLEALYL